MRVELVCDVLEDGAVVYVLLRMSADLALSSERGPVNLALAIDRSSSMRGPRIKQAVAAADELVSRLEERDRLAVIGFDNTARTIFGPTSMTGQAKAEARAALAGLETGVGTNLAAAIHKGAEAITSGFVRGAVSRLILLTDGQPSVGVTDVARLANLVEKEYERGVTLTAMGVGHGFEDELLAELARRGRGGFYYLASPSDIPAAFGRELDGVFTIAAAGVELKFLPQDDVVSVEVLHRLPAMVLEEGLLVDVGEVAAGAPRLALLKVIRDPQSVARTLGTVTVTHRRPGGKRGDPKFIAVDVPPDRAEKKAVQAERLRLAVASAVDTAWARRASSDSSGALFGLETVRERVLAAREDDEIESDVASALLDEMTAAEDAVQKTALERARLRRGQREQSQITLLGRSEVFRVPADDD